MEQEREDAMGEVLYEIRHHASRVSSPDSPQEQLSEGSKGGLLSYLSVPGVNQLREKWHEYKRPRKFKKRVSLVVSPDGEHVAVAAENRIIILRKDDDYMEPCGIFISNDRRTVFIDGAWLEPQGILGVIDDMSTLYFIKSNGEEITRRTCSQLKLSAPIVELIVLDNLNTNSFLCGFCIFTADGLLYHVEAAQEPSVCSYLIPTSSDFLKQKRQSHHNFSCLDFHPDLSLVVLVGASSVPVNYGGHAGLYSLYLLHINTSSELKLRFCSPHFDGLFSSSKGYTSPLASPKVAISPQGHYIATLDLKGSIDVFNLDSENYSLSLLSFAERQYAQGSDNLVLDRKNYLNDIVDFSWWADHILILAKRSGSIIMYDVLRGMKVIEKNPVFRMPVIERVKHRQGCVFVLESTSSEGRLSMPQHVEYVDMQHSEHITFVDDHQLDTGRLSWSLISFSGRSVSEMYTYLISTQRYREALEFANRHGLDSDEVFKKQWLCSDQGIHEINMFLSKIKDLIFVLSECVDKVGPTEDVVKYSVSYGLQVTDQYKFLDPDDGESSLIWDLRLFRLMLLQYKDKLETFVGINMGRFSAQEYSKFRIMPLTETAIRLAESGKIGALNLLFKRHPYSLSFSMFEIFSAIPETIPVQSYSQLLPGRSPPSTIVLRNGDWVECEKIVSFINKLPHRFEKGIDIRTENILKHFVGFTWPSAVELSDWYKNRARDIENMSGQLDNCLSLVECACRKGIVELQRFFEDISYLHQLIYSDGCDEDFTMTLVTWEQLSDYEKFRMMLKGVKTEMVVERLREKAIPFMQNRFCSKASDSVSHMKGDQYVVHSEQKDSFQVRWLKEVAAENKLDICLAVIENACGDSPVDGLFKDESETIETTLHCIYLCTLTDQWNIMASILSKLPRRSLSEKAGEDFTQRHSTQGYGTPRFSYLKNKLSVSEWQSNPVSLHEGDSVPQHSLGFDGQLDTDIDTLENRIKVAEGHVEVGRMLAYYQVPKPMSFFLGARSDEKNVKQLLRLILSKFGRRQPGRSDNEWANMWRDMQCFQERAFPFLDTEYMLTEFCRGLLKAGKFSLARNYLKGTGTIALATEKAENLVIQAAREYFFSASSLACTEIWKAKECLSLFPNSKNVQAEADVIDALTIRLPNLGVTLLPMEFRQIRNPMEIINMVIANQTGAYVDVEELIEIAKLLGLRSEDDITAVEEAVARESAVAGDMQLAFDLCLALAKKGHGPIWDLCAAIARGPHLDNMDTSSRKQLLGFALSHCDEESIGELLHAWKDVDIRNNYEQLMTSTGTCPPNFSVHGSSIMPLPVHSLQDIFDLRENSEPVCWDNNQVQFESVKEVLSKVGMDLSAENGVSWDSLLRENRKVLTFAALELPWLLQLTREEEYGKNAILGAKAPFRKHYISIRMQALISILYWLAGNDIAPRDHLIASLAKSIMESPVTEEDDVLGCSFLLNLIDAFHGVEIIEEQVKKREAYQEIYSIMNIGMTYSSLNNLHKDCISPDQRRKLLLSKFRQKHAPFSSDEMDQIDKVQSSFWREWKRKLEEQRRLADQARALEQIIPGIETARFLSGDIGYIKDAVFSFIDSVKMEKRHILKEAVKLADTYGLRRTEVLLRFFGCALVSDHWGNDDILAEISEFREDIVTCPQGVIDMICTVVYPEIDGHNKQRLSYIYSILSACYLRLRTEEPASTVHRDRGHKHILEPFQFCKVIEQECRRVSFISGLNFKNIAVLDDLNFEHFNEEIYNNIHDSTVEALADMVRTLVAIYDNSQANGLISWQAVYKHHVLGLLASLETEIEARSNSENPDELQAILREIELNYDVCKKYVRYLSGADMSHIIGRYCMLCIPCNISGSIAYESEWKDCLIMLLNFWIKVADDFTIDASQEKLVCTDAKSLSRCLEVFKRLVMEGEISENQGWRTIHDFREHGLVDGLHTDISCFFRVMIFSGCRYKSIAQVYYEAGGESTTLLDLYTSLTDSALLDVSRGSDDHQYLHRLLSSLSRPEGDHTEDLKMIRSEVWGKLSALSDNIQQESHVRVYALELMQSVTGNNFRSLPVSLVSEIEPWVGWDESCGTKASVTTELADVPRSITSTIVALKSARLVAAISPDLRVTPEDLMTPDSAVSCFLRICEAATSKANIDVLQTILHEWEELFSSSTEKEKADVSREELNNWSSDNWDEGWESLSDEPPSTEVKQDGAVSVRPLHKCWMEIIKRLVGLSEPGAVIVLLDRSLPKPGVLLDEVEAQCLVQLVSEVDCFTALKTLLLLPYEAPQVQCLRAVEAKTRGGGFSRRVDDDYELLTLLLSSGALRVVGTDPAFAKLLSYFCYLMGHLARICQEDLLKCSRDGGRPRDGSILFGRVLLPCFVSELVKAGQFLLAGFIVSRWMHVPKSLGLLDVAESCLRKYLEGQILQAQLTGGGGGESGLAEVDSFGSLVNTVHSLRGMLGSLLQSALSALPTSTS